MAYIETLVLEDDEGYNLGYYTFELERTSVPGSTNDKIEAIFTNNEGKSARKSIQIPSNQNLGGWYVEANNTEATVYAIVQVPIGNEKESHIVQPFAYSSGPYTDTWHYYQYTYSKTYSCIGCVGVSYGPPNAYMIFAASGPGAIYRETYQDDIDPSSEPRITDRNVSSTYTYDGKTVYYTYFGTGVFGEFTPYDNSSCPKRKIDGGDASKQDIAWAMIYGTSTGDEYEEKTMLVGRFAIELEDAGGVGPESDWVDPGDYDPDWEEGDPTHTLYVTVTGALSGRHNDPIEDPSYSYIPADKDTVKGYGCGGDGGNGGGGGAGASTVVVNKFATDLANYKEVTAIARRHGYGSGGGKGGKGGDGCILVYY